MVHVPVPVVVLLVGVHLHRRQPLERDEAQHHGRGPLAPGVRDGLVDVVDPVVRPTRGPDHSRGDVGRAGPA